MFSQLSFENFWLHLLGEVVMTQNYFNKKLKKKNYFKSPLKVCDLKV